MADSIPETLGVDINGVVYRYTVDKNVQDDMLVHIQNKDTQGSGYIFRETDDWSGLPGATLNKAVVVPNLPASRFGEGEIAVEGTGTVRDASVVYTYRIDTTVQPEPPANVPEVVVIEVYDALEDENISTDETDTDAYDDDENTEDESSDEADEDERRENRRMLALQASDNAVAVAQNAMLQAMTQATNINTYYAASIKGGVYKETNTLVDAKLPNSQRGLRNGLAQQLLHTKMVDAQWER